MLESDAVRAHFVLPEGRYFLSHSVGCLPAATKAKVETTVFNEWGAKGGNAWPTWLTMLNEFQFALSRLMGGEASDYCPQSNLSSGLTKLLGSIDAMQSRRTVLMSADAFPSMGFVVQAMDKLGFRLKLLAGPQDLAAWRKGLTDDVAVALITHVHSNTGYRNPVDDIIEICRERSVFTIVDVAQSAGVIPLDFRKWGCDAALGSCVKWLCGGPGAGFIYLKPDRIDALKPIDVGWFSHADPFAFDIRDFTFAGDAMRFMGGTPSILPFATALTGLVLIADTGVEAILAHNRRLWRDVVEALDIRIDLNAVGGTWCLPLPSCPDFAQDVFAREGILTDRRGETFRFSFHAYNSDEEAHHLLAALETCLGCRP